MNEIRMKKRQINECYKIYNNFKTLIATDIDNDTIDQISTIMKEIERDKAHYGRQFTQKNYIY